MLTLQDSQTLRFFCATLDSGQRNHLRLEQLDFLLDPAVLFLEAPHAFEGAIVELADVHAALVLGRSFLAVLASLGRLRALFEVITQFFYALYPISVRRLTVGKGLGQFLLALLFLDYSFARILAASLLRALLLSLAFLLGARFRFFHLLFFFLFLFVCIYMMLVNLAVEWTA